VSLASNGEEGLRLAAATRPAAILVDSVMTGIDGAAVIRKIRMDAALHETPCVLLAGSGEPDVELRALDAGADGFVRKEEDTEAIVARLASILRPARVAPVDGTTPLGPKRILAVDDDLAYLDHLGTILRDEGYDVLMAHSGEEAIEALSVQPVDCILLDLMMPGTGGRETCKRIKASPAARDTPLIVLTALEGRDAVVEGLSAGADDVVAKSSDVEVVRARVGAQLRRKQIEDEHRKIREDLLRSELAASEERAARRVAEARAALVDELERKNHELETFTYSVSHDLRAPLRAIHGFGQILLEDCGDVLDEESQRRLRMMQSAAERMARLIDDLMGLSRLGRAELRRTQVDVSAVARAVADELGRGSPERAASFVIAADMTAEADAGLVRVLLDNVMGNAWKFTASVPDARIDVGATRSSETTTFFVRDNGAGFDMAYAQKLFRPFQRLHTEEQFPGTGIGLATVHRVVDRHGGRVWAEGALGKGATFFFTLSGPRGGRVV
jgi:DNA-binding response OmpR family regulator